jgi:hypothetical protein
VPDFKQNVRKLKNLGLTISLGVVTSLSPRERRSSPGEAEPWTRAAVPRTIVPWRHPVFSRSRNLSTARRRCLPRWSVNATQPSRQPFTYAVPEGPEVHLGQAVFVRSGRESCRASCWASAIQPSWTACDRSAPSRPEPGTRCGSHRAGTLDERRVPGAIV